MSEKKETRLLCSEKPRGDAWVTRTTTFGHTNSFLSLPMVIAAEDLDTEWYQTAQKEISWGDDPGSVSLTVFIEHWDFQGKRTGLYRNL